MLILCYNILNIRVNIIKLEVLTFQQFWNKL